MPAYQKIAHWIIGHLLWDVSGAAREGFRGWLGAKWRLFVAVPVAALLTWGEWVEHHPPEIAIVALIHFIFVLVAIAVVLQIVRWSGHRHKRLSSGQSKGPHS